MERLSPSKVELLTDLGEIERILEGVRHALRNLEHPRIVVTSSRRGEGKTTLTALLASVTAKTLGGPVLAADLNWHQPALHSCFGHERSLSLEAVRSSQNLAGAVLSTALPNLFVIPAPPPEEVELLDGFALREAAGRVLEWAGGEFPWVWVDSGSLFPMNRRMVDPVTLGAAASGVVLVALGGVTPRQEVRRAVSYLEGAGAEILGVVLNQWRNPLAAQG
ncbi:MAG: CpsD/CapB family tyrosine-protein kinase [Acidobacteriota bacterium]